LASHAKETPLPSVEGQVARETSQWQEMPGVVKSPRTEHLVSGFSSKDQRLEFRESDNKCADDFENQQVANECLQNPCSKTVVKVSTPRTSLHSASKLPSLLVASNSRRSKSVDEEVAKSLSSPICSQAVTKQSSTAQGTVGGEEMQVTIQSSWPTIDRTEAKLEVDTSNCAYDTIPQMSSTGQDKDLALASPRADTCSEGTLCSKALPQVSSVADSASNATLCSRDLPLALGKGENGSAAKSSAFSRSLLGHWRRTSICSKDSDNLRQASFAEHISGDLEKSQSRQTLRTLRAASLKNATAYWDSSAKLEGRVDLAMLVVILLNLLQLGLRSDVEREWTGWFIMDILFCLAFLVEFVCKLLIRGWFLHLVILWKGALLDTIIVTVAVVEVIGSLVATGRRSAGGSTLSPVRLLRLLRLVRIVKLLRLPVFKDLRMMCQGLLDGAQTYAWSVVLLLVPIYASALVMRETIGEDKDNEQVTKQFSSLPWSFFTVFRCVMGDCTTESGQPLPELLVAAFGWPFGLGYGSMIMLCSFGLFNIIMAINVENLIAAARKNEALQRGRRVGDEERLNALLAEFLQEIVRLADDGSANRASRDVGLDIEAAAKLKLTRSFFDEVFKSERVNRILDNLEIPMEERSDLFEIWDADGSGTLTMAEVVDGLKKMRGPPKRSDVITNVLATRALQKRVHLEQENIFNAVASNARTLKRIINSSEADTSKILDQLASLQSEVMLMKATLPQVFTLT